MAGDAAGSLGRVVAVGIDTVVLSPGMAVAEALLEEAGFRRVALATPYAVYRRGGL